MANVTLINYTGFGHPDPLFAARLLAFTKATRLQMTPDGFEDFQSKDWGEILHDLDYMAGTIPSSWEFVDVTFLITNLSRATAQQVTRTRTASFAMQTQRIAELQGVTWDAKGATSLAERAFTELMRDSVEGYHYLVTNGMPPEDARDVLPIGAHCNLVAKYNFRTLVEMCIARESIRVQGPYRDIVKQMKALVLHVWPWAEVFFEPREAKALSMLQEVAEELAEKGAVFKGPAGKIAKAIDLIKKG